MPKAASLQAQQENLRLELKRENNERFAEDRMAQDRRERMLAVLHQICRLRHTAADHHHRVTFRTQVLHERRRGALACMSATAVPFVTSFFAFLVTIASLSLRHRQAKVNLCS